MVSKIYAISKPSATIALNYGPNVSKGILGMANEIERLERYNTDLRERLRNVVGGGEKGGMYIV